MSDRTNPPTHDTPEPPANRMLVLPSAYQHAILGCTVDPLTPPRWVYSLEKMANAYRRDSPVPVTIETAREQVWRMIQEISAQHGPRTPVFIDDTARHEHGPKLWTPGN